jgi:3-phosphoglycerate kinase
MNEVKNVVVKVDGRTFTLEVDITEENLITAMISTFGLSIKKGAPVRVVQSSSQPLSKSQSMFSKVLNTVKELGEWAEDLKKLLRVQKSQI